MLLDLHRTQGVKFHRKIIDGSAYEFKIHRSRHVLILGFNGADGRAVTVAFRTACTENDIRGVSVYMASDVINQWDLSLQLDETKSKIESLIIGPAGSVDDDDNSSARTA